MARIAHFLGHNSDDGLKFFNHLNTGQVPNLDCDFMGGSDLIMYLS